MAGSSRPCTSSAAATCSAAGITSLLVCPRFAFMLVEAPLPAGANALLISPGARRKGRGNGSPLMGRFYSARAVCAPYNASAGTRISPTCHVRYETLLSPSPFAALNLAGPIRAACINASSSPTPPSTAGKLLLHSWSSISRGLRPLDEKAAGALRGPAGRPLRYRRD